MIDLAIVVPTFNRANFLKKTLDSICHEVRRYPDRNIPIYVSDNCSTDNTKALVRDYLDCKIQYRCNESNLGFDSNVDASIIFADDAKYVLVLSDDDFLIENALSRYFTLIDSGVSVAYGAAIFMDHDMQNVNPDFRDKSFENLREPRTYLFQSGIEYYAKTKKMYCGISGVMFNRDCYMAIDRNPFIGGQFIHVAAIFKMLAKPGASIGVINLPVIRYRMGPVNASIKKQEAVMMVGLGLLDLFKKVSNDYPWTVFGTLYNKELAWVRGLLIGIKSREILSESIKAKYLSMLLPQRRLAYIDAIIFLIPHWIFRLTYKLYRLIRYQSF